MSVSKHSLEIAETEKENAQLRACLERAGWGPCNIPACNCNGWHHLRPSRYEQEMIDEATDSLREQLRTERERNKSAIQRLRDELVRLLDSVAQVDRDSIEAVIEETRIR